MINVRNGTELLGRILLATLFLLSGVGKISAYAATTGYMASAGVPGPLLPLVIALEVGGAVAIIAGWNTRTVAILLAGFSLASGALFHHAFGDQMQLVMFLKNLSIAGAFLLLAVHGAGPLSLDARRTTQAFVRGTRALG